MASMTVQASLMDNDELAVVVLAAGRGKRFGEEYTKLLHPVFDKPLIYYPIQNLINLSVRNISVVVSDPQVEEEIKKYLNCRFVYQKDLTGTADAVKLAMEGLSPDIKILLVLNGDDATLYSKKTLEEFIKSHEANKADISMMTLKTNRNMEVGRVIRDKGRRFSKILEYKEYLESGAASKEINCGVYLINADFAKENLPKIKRSTSGEYYLTNLLNIAKEENKRINLYVLKNHSEWIGINDKKDLKYAMNTIKKRNLVTQEEKKPPSKKVHFLGIAGSGTSACARLASELGFEVTGCDKNLEGEFLKASSGIQTFEGHDPSHLDGVEILAVTPAILSLDPDNSELIEAKKRKIKILTWQQFLGKYITKNKTVIAVAGTHGKSTTTAMAGKVLEDCGYDPTVLLGANTHFWDNNFLVGGSDYFVIEADEYNDNFMSLDPKITVLTNIEYDHPEYFKDYESYVKSFQNFLHKTQEVIIANLNDPGARETLEEKEGSNEPFFPPVLDFSKNLIDFPLKVSGVHNIYAASAVYNLALHLGINAERIKKSLQDFPGIGRRMELIGEINGAKIFSDFAHHPTAIKVATEQLKKQYPEKNIWIVYQPHMFSRTKALFKQFAQAFKDLNVSGVAITDIYPSRETDTGIVHAKDLVKEINKPNVEYAENLDPFFDAMKKMLSEKDILVFMGAGNIDQIARRKLNGL
jgi:UDP-N-acetylmuramate--alanine ligase